ncbi:MAG: hypothetical protein ABI456_19215 [Ktedonobacteraceae bacterium]|nr:hypothetical protein [Chloroflexota bacterium]
MTKPIIVVINEGSVEDCWEGIATTSTTSVLPEGRASVHGRIAMAVFFAKTGRPIL